MSFLPNKNPTRGEIYSSAAGDFSVTVNAGGKTVTITDPSLGAITPNMIIGAIMWNVSGGVYTKSDIPINNISISSFTFTFNDLVSNFDGTETVEIYILGTKKTITETNSGDIKTAVELIDDSVHTDDGAFTAGADKGVALLGVNSADTIDSDDYGVVKINEDRQQEMAGYSSISNSQRTSEVDGLDQKYVYEETELTNISTNTTGYIYFDMDGVKNIGLQTEVTNGTDTLTYTLEATNQNDGTVPASCTYQDVTSDLTGSASFTASDFHLIDTPLPVKYLRLKYVTSNDSGNDCDLTVYSKKLF